MSFAEDLLRVLYQRLDPRSISREDRKRLHIEKDDFTYGEVMYFSFLNLLHFAKLRQGEIFYDLGCGSGKAVFIAALCFDLQKACGIEFLPGLYQLAKSQLTHAKDWIKQHDQLTQQEWLKRIASIQFIHDDFLNVDIADADVVFINATCLHYDVWQSLLKKLNTLKIGSRVIVTTKSIVMDHFKLIYENPAQMSWGESYVRIYVKTTSLASKENEHSSL